MLVLASLLFYCSDNGVVGGASENKKKRFFFLTLFVVVLCFFFFFVYFTDTELISSWYLLNFVESRLLRRLSFSHMAGIILSQKQKCHSCRHRSIHRARLAAAGS